MSALPPDIDFKADKSASPDRMNRAMSSIDARIKALETYKPNFDALFAELQEFGLSRINEAVFPIIDALANVEALGFLNAPIENGTTAEFETGAKVVTIAGDRRKYFTPSPWLMMVRSSNQNDYALGKLISYDQATGELFINITNVWGDGGAFSDVTIWGVAGGVLSAIESAETTAADRLACEAAAEAAGLSEATAITKANEAAAHDANAAASASTSATKAGQALAAAAAAAASAEDVASYVGYAPESVVYTATAGQTSFSAVYTGNAVDVFRNGVRLVKGTDFTAPDGMSITLTNPATAGDVIEIVTHYAANTKNVSGILTNFTVTPPKNIYDPSRAVDGKLYNYIDGGLAAFANSAISGLVPVVEGNTYTFSQPSPEKGFYPHLYFWNSSGGYLGMDALITTNPVVSGINLVASSPGGTGGYRNLKFDVPVGSGIRYVSTMILYGYAAHTTADFDRIRNSIQLELGAAATSFVAYTGVSTYALKAAAIPSFPQVDTNTTNVTGILTNFDITVPKNKYNPSLAVDSKLYNYDGTLATYANCAVSGLVPVVEGNTYVFSQQAPEVGFFPHLYFWNSSGTFLGMDALITTNPVVSGVNLVASDAGGTSGYRQIKFTVPVGSGVAFVGALLIYNYAAHTTTDFDRIRNGVQLEIGSTATAFAAYTTANTYSLKSSAYSDGLQKPISPLKVTKSGSYLYVRSSFDATYDLVQQIKLENASGASANTGNDTVNVQGARKALKTVTDNASAWASGTIIQTSGDDATPLNYNGTYIGANHGAFIVMNVNATSHGKAVQDVGSEWTDGASVKWYLMKIVDANNLWFVSQNYRTYPDWLFSATMTGNLTHSSGATNTGGITVGTKTQTQLWPSVQGKTVNIYLDGITEMTADGNAICNTVDIVETYNICNPAAVVAYVRSQVGGSTQSSFVHGSIAADVRRTITYRYAENGSCNIVDGIRCLNPLTIGYFGAVQAASLTYTGKQLWQYVPRVSAKVGTVKTWNFQSQEQIDGTFEQVNLTSTEWIDANNPPDRMAQIVKTAGVSEFGLMVGISSIRSVGVPATRKTLVNDACFVSSARKQYPKAVNLGTLVAGSYFEIVAFRAYWAASANTDATCFTWYRDGKSIVVIADFHAAVDTRLKLPSQFNGMDWVVVDKSASATVKGNGVVTPDGIYVSTTGTYGYVVLKLS